MHNCDNPKCCNPKHLSLGTHADNSNDMKSKNRQVRGNKVRVAKLDIPSVLHIRAQHANGESQHSLAKKYGVSKTSIKSVVNKISWKHI